MNDQHLPFSPEAEKAVLGAILTNPKGYHQAATLIKSKTDFFLLRHQYIWEAMQQCLQGADTFDYLTIAEAIKGQGHLDEIGGVPYLMGLINNTPTSVHCEVYAELVARAGLRRRIISAGSEIIKVAYQEDLSIDKVIADTETHVVNALATGVNGHTVSLRDGLTDYFERVDNILQGKNDCLGIPSGFKDVDDLTRGAKRGQLVYVAGRPGMGKTAFLLNMALNAAKQGQRVFMWSGEMSTEENIARLVSMESGINAMKLETGGLSQDELSRFTESALHRMIDLPMQIDDTAYMTVEQLRSLCIREQMQRGLDLVVVDYIGLLSSSRRMQNRNAEMGHYSRNLKRLAMELRVPVIAAAQLNRDLERRQDKRPVLADLRDSGELEQDANLVLFLYRDEVYNEATEHPGICEIIVAKHRSGPTGTAFLKFNRPVMRFENTTLKVVNLNGGQPHDNRVAG